MKILLALDGSPCSGEALREVIERPWPEATEVKVISVAHAVPFIPDPFLLGAAIRVDSLEQERKLAENVVAQATKTLRAEAPGLRVTSKVVDGAPKEVLIEEARHWPADLIVLGSHGRGALKRTFLGSVSQAAALYAPCSVEIVRGKVCVPEEGIAD